MNAAVKKRRILVVDNSPALTGAYKSVSLMTEALRDEFDFFFCLPPGSQLLTASSMKRPTFPLALLEIKKGVSLVLYLPMLFINSVRLILLIRKNAIEILHINDVYNMAGVMVKALFPRIAVTYHVRLMPTSYASTLYRFWLKLIRRYADGVICVSHAVKNAMGRRMKATVIPDSVVIERPIALTHPVNRDTITLLYLANYIRGKGHDYAVRAFAMAVKENPKLKLCMAGGDLGLTKNRRYKEELIQLAKAVQVVDRITFLSFVSDTASLYLSADIFLNFSESESFSLTCLEALSYGVPVIATDSGGPAELFEPGISGMLVPVGDIQAMTAAILKLSGDADMRLQMGFRGRLGVSQSFSIEKSAALLKEFFVSIADTASETTN